jgi:two-component system LytT family response regulator
MKVIRSLIIDDERLARAAIRSLLGPMPFVEVLDEAATLADAKSKIKSLRPDVIFLDIEMPGGEGFDLLEELNPVPEVILVTAYEEYALKAYDFEVVDYLLKPIQPLKLKRSLDRLRARIHSNEPGMSAPQGAQLSPARLISLNHGKILLDPESILVILADGNYTRVILNGNQEKFVRQSMREWEEILPANSFLRIDRKMILQVAKISQLTFESHQARFFIGDHPKPYVVGRSAATKLRDFFSDT